MNIKIIKYKKIIENEHDNFVRSESCLYRLMTDLPGLVIGGGLVMVQLRGTLGLFSRLAIGLRGSISITVWPLTEKNKRWLNKGHNFKYSWMRKLWLLLTNWFILNNWDGSRLLQKIIYFTVLGQVQLITDYSKPFKTACWFWKHTLVLSPL